MSNFTTKWYIAFIQTDKIEIVQLLYFFILYYDYSRENMKRDVSKYHPILCQIYTNDWLKNLLQLEHP